MTVPPAGPNAPPLPRRLTRARLYDLGGAAPLILIYAVGIIASAFRTQDALAQATPFAGPRTLIFVGLNLATIAFAGIQIVLFLVRRLPERRARGVLPGLAGVVGSNVQLAFLFLPRARESPVVLIASPVLVTLGLACSCAVIATLGRSFSILPQARRLVTHGVYRWVRHPLYLAEMITTLGVMLQFAWPQTLVVAIISIAAQFPRMHYEEAVLTEAYPAYAGYMARTWRLAPFLY